MQYNTQLQFSLSFKQVKRNSPNNILQQFRRVLWSAGSSSHMQFIRFSPDNFTPNRHFSTEHPQYSEL